MRVRRQPVVGTSQAIAFDQWFGGSRVPCAGVASVAVLPEYRGRGVAGALMTQLLQHRRGQGDAVSTLYPANAQLYRRLGYEFAGLRPEFRAPWQTCRRPKERSNWWDQRTWLT